MHLGCFEKSWVIRTLCVLPWLHTKLCMKTCASLGNHTQKTPPQSAFTDASNLWEVAFKGSPNIWAAILDHITGPAELSWTDSLALRSAAPKLHHESRAALHAVRDCCLQFRLSWQLCGSLGFKSKHFLPKRCILALVQECRVCPVLVCHLIGKCLYPELLKLLSCWYYISKPNIAGCKLLKLTSHRIAILIHIITEDHFSVPKLWLLCWRFWTNGGHKHQRNGSTSLVEGSGSICEGLFAYKP